MATTYSPAPAVASVVAELVRKHHSALQCGTRIVCLFREPTPMARGRLCLASVRIVTGLSAYLMDHRDLARELTPDTTATPEPFVLILVARKEWTLLPPEQWLPVLDHQLCHIHVDPDTGALEMLPHDIEEFTEVVARHGLYTHELESAATVLRDAGRPKQLVFELGPPGEPAVVDLHKGQDVTWSTGTHQLRGQVVAVRGEIADVQRSDGYRGEAPVAQLRMVRRAAG